MREKKKKIEKSRLLHIRLESQSSHDIIKARNINKAKEMKRRIEKFKDRENKTKHHISSVFKKVKNSTTTATKNKKMHLLMLKFTQVS